MGLDTGPTCYNGDCQCGSGDGKKSCAGEGSGQKCVAGVCKCTDTLDSCADPSGSYCDPTAISGAGVCKCSASVPKCSNPGELCVGGQCKCGTEDSCVGKMTGEHCDGSTCKCSQTMAACQGCTNEMCPGKFLNSFFNSESQILKINLQYEDDSYVYIVYISTLLIQPLHYQAMR